MLEDRILVVGGPGLLSRKEIPGLYPSVSSFKEFLRIRFEDQALSREEAENVAKQIRGLPEKQDCRYEITGSSPTTPVTPRRETH